MFVDSCIFECYICKQGHKTNYEVKRNMKHETKNQDSGIQNTESSIKENTSTMDTSIQGAGTNKSIPSIEDVLPDGDVFTYPLLEEFHGGKEKKEAILERAEIITGSYGESAALKLNGENYRSNSKAIVSQVKKLLIFLR